MLNMFVYVDLCCSFQVLGIGYDDVVLGDDYNILRSLLKTECSGKFRLAQDFLGTSTLSAAEVGLSLIRNS